MSAASNQIAALEKEILEKKKELATLRRAQPPKSVADHIFQSPSGNVTLSSLFGDKSDLVLVSNMGKSCSYCTLWADGFNGVVPELESRAGFAFMSADPLDVLMPFATERGWRFNYFSGDEATRKALETVGPDGGPWPMAIGLHKNEDGTIVEIARAEFGEGDDFCPTWHLFDLLKDGWNGWDPDGRL